MSARALCQVDDFIHFSKPHLAGISSLASVFYQKGYSLGQISLEPKVSKDKVRRALLTAGVTLRPSNHSQLGKQMMARRLISSGNAPYGFMSDENRLIKNPKELTVVRKITDMWAMGFGVTDITRKINSLKIKTRKGCAWDHSLVGRLIRRFKKDNLYKEALK